MGHNRDANSGRFRYPNRPMSPGESKANITHLDLTTDANAKPVTQNFTRDTLTQQQGQQRRSPSNEPAAQLSQPEV